jgi:hypothetical protein
MFGVFVPIGRDELLLVRVLYRGSDETIAVAPDPFG